MARATGLSPVVPGLLVSPEKPHERVVQTGFRNVNERHGDALARTRPSIRLANIRAARLFQALDKAKGIGKPRLREGIQNVAPATFEYPKNIPGLYRLPGRQRCKLRLHTVVLLRSGGVLSGGPAMADPSPSRV